MYHEHIKGLKSEHRVMNSLSKQGWKLVSHRVQTPFAELDLIFKKADVLRIIEVKSISSWDFVSYRVTKKQKTRLIQAFNYLQQRFKGEVILELALVSGNGDILFIEIENNC